MSVECLILDLDDTLCDYQSAKKNAIKRIDRELEQYDMEPEVFWAIYEKVESLLEIKLLDGEISWREYRERRFHDALKAICDHCEVLSGILNNIFMQEGNANIDLFDDVLPVMSRVKAQGIIPAILSNGPSDGQREKIRHLGLDKYISHIYISEELGVSKPHKLIFDFALRDLATEASKVLMIGDSIEHDFEGARQAGIRCVLIDRFNKHPDFKHDKIPKLTDIWHEDVIPVGRDT